MQNNLPAQSVEHQRRDIPLRLSIGHLEESTDPRILVEITTTDAHNLQHKTQCNKFSIVLRVNQQGTELTAFIYPDAQKGSRFSHSKEGYVVLDRKIHNVEFHGKEHVSKGIKRTEVSWCVVNDKGINCGVLLADIKEALLKPKSQSSKESKPMDTHAQTINENISPLNDEELSILMSGGDLPGSEEDTLSSVSHLERSASNCSELTLEEIVDWRNELQNMIARFNKQDNGQRIEADLKLDVTKVVVQHMSL